MLSYPSGMSVTSGALNMLAEALRHEGLVRRTPLAAPRRGTAGFVGAVLPAQRRDVYGPGNPGSPSARPRSRRGKRSSLSTACCCVSIGLGWPRAGIARTTRETQKAWRKRAAHRGPGRAIDLGLTRTARRPARHGRRKRTWLDRRPDHRWGRVVADSAYRGAGANIEVRNAV